MHKAGRWERFERTGTALGGSTVGVMTDLTTLLAVVGTGCWAICFWWMRRISARQDALLAALHEQGQRIEALSKAEHDLIKEVHPSVETIKEDVQQVAAAVVDSTPQKSQ